MPSSRIGLGSVQFGLDYGVANDAGKVLLNEAQQIILLAKEESIDVLDTAIAYGTSEKVLGKLAWILSSGDEVTASKIRTILLFGCVSRSRVL